jgi:antitoxin (DNA-binding transcriptional repressor) of toxin-antitoxin stability system
LLENRIEVLKPGTPLDSGPKTLYHQDMTVTADIGTSVLRDLVNHIRAGDEVLLTDGDKPVAKIVPAAEKKAASGFEFNVPSFKGHRVLYSSPITQAEIAEEMFDR